MAAIFKIPKYLKTFYVLFFFFVVITLQSLNAQNTRITGYVTTENGAPIPYVNVGTYDNNSPIGAATAENGYYEFEVFPNVEYTVMFSCVGYEKKSVKVKLSKGEIKKLNIKLKLQTADLPSFEATDKAIRPGGFTRINPRNAREIPSPTGGVESLVKLQAGVSSNNELSSQYSVRGGNFDENLVYVNDIEVYRPFLVRSGQQEGLSFINSDMVSSLLFSAGGYDAKYGDKMSSVLDIQYRKPVEFSGSVGLSLLGGSLFLQGNLKKSPFTYMVGLRQKSNQYVLGALQTKGEYRPSFTDVQTLLTYDISKKLEISFLGNYARNVYNVVPENRETDFGTVNQALRFKVYFDGQEVDRFETWFGALSLTHRPNNNTKLKYIISAFRSDERETFDIQGQYWLYQLEADFGKDDFGQEAFNRGIGTYLDHARNYLNATILNAEHRGIYSKGRSSLQWGVKAQYEAINDKMKEWKLVDSSDYSLPNPPDEIGNPNPTPSTPQLQNVLTSENNLVSGRLSAYVQNTWNLDDELNRFNLTVGARVHYWTYNKTPLLSPRASFNYKPMWTRDITFRFATGIYFQPPFYKEFRDSKGNLNENIKAQRSVHVVLGSDWNLKIWKRPFKFVSEVYYKYLTNLIPYDVDNVRIRYYAENSAHGYATGVDFRLNGEFVKGIESWASLSVMKTAEDIENDGYDGYIARPTDQRVTFSLFFQDYLPKNPNIKMHLTLVFGTGLPFNTPDMPKYKQDFRMPSYRRVDIGSSYLIKGENSKVSLKNPFRFFRSVWLSLEVFNLLQVSNTVSYLWITDVTNTRYAIPNYLTPRQLNLKLVADF